MKKLILGELDKGDTFYLVKYDGNYISSIETKTVDSILNIKIGRIVHYDTDIKNKTSLGFTIENNKFGKTIIPVFYEMKVCSNKEDVLKLLEEDKEKFINNYNEMLASIIYGKI